MTLSIEVYFDFICPWCLIGKRQLDQALAQLRVAQPEVQVAVSWRGVQLLPALPVQGEDFHDFYLRRLGSEQAMGLRQAQVRQAAASVGVELDFGNIPRMPNTADAHRLWQRACQLGSPAQLDELLEWLFACHFLHGGDLGDGATLLGLAEAAGFGSADLVSCLQGDGTPFHCDLPGAAQQGVPSFVMGKGLTLSGAQPVAQLLASLRASDALEALFGAVYLDAGFDRAKVVVGNLFTARLDAIAPDQPIKDPKTRLQEYLQARRQPLPVYTLAATDGQAHLQQFRVLCEVASAALQTEGQGSSRRAAEQQSAQRALELLPKQ